MPESAKECDTVLPEGLDIGLGPSGREFESPISDQNVLIKKMHSRNAARKCGISAFLQKMMAK